MAHLEEDRGRSTAEFAPHVIAVPPPAVAARHFRWPVVALAVLGGLIAWEAGVRLTLVSPLYFPAPSAIFTRLGALAASGDLGTDFTVTMLRMTVGVAGGGLLGLGLGLVMGWSSRLRSLIDPFVAAIHPLPKIALLPLIMVIFGIGNLSFIIVIGLGAFFPMLINTMVGVTQIPTIYFDVARNYGATRLQIFRRIIWPGCRPLVLTGLRLALNVTLLLAVAVEMVGSPNGLGNMIWMAWGTMRIEDIYVSLFIIMGLGLTFNGTLSLLHSRVIPWQVERTV